MANTLISRLQGNKLSNIVWLQAGLLAAACLAGQPALALQPMPDDQLSEVTGQSLIALSVINESGPNAQGNNLANAGKNLTFYKLSIQAILEMNLNVDRLQLGCGGNNTGMFGSTASECDLDIERLRLHGLDARAEGQPIVNGQPALAGPDTGPRGSAVITNPYVELAIKNNSNAASRSLAGVRFGAQTIDGATSIGENPILNSVTDDTGFNRFSGYARFAISDLILPTKICTLGANAERNGCGFLSFVVASATGKIVNPATGNRHFHAVHDVRLNTTVVSNIPLVTSGITLEVLGFPLPPLPDVLPLGVSATMELILPTLHRIDFDGAKDVFISLQGKAVPSAGNKDDVNGIRWKQDKPNFEQDLDNNEISDVYNQNAWSAQLRPGWSLNTPNVEFRGFKAEPLHVSLPEVVGGLFGISLNVGAVDTGARPADNCWGALTFC